MCVTWTVHYACGCDEGAKEASNGCDGNCTGSNVTYDESRDVVETEDCFEHKAARQLQTPSTSSDGSASETSEE
jgi:hypothetical protein